MSESDIELARHGLGKILSNYFLAVPVNQRSYLWKQEHVRDFFQDLQHAITEDRDRDYFLGTVVLTRAEHDEMEVADGQQRLATASILIAAIRDFLFRKGDKRYHDVHGQYLLKTDLLTEELRPRLRLNVEDNDFFRKRVLSLPDSDDRRQKPVKLSHNRIAAAADLAKEHVENLASHHGGDAVKRILEWVVFLERHARVIVFTVADHADAFVVFETLNDRGLELSKADLLKNFLFGRAGHDRMKEVQHAWAQMTGAVETVDDEEITVTYIRHLWISSYGYTREKDLYKSIKDEIKSKQATVDLAGQLGKNARLYVALLNASHHEVWNMFPPKTRLYVSLIREMGWKQIRPLMLALVTSMKPKEVEKAFRAFVCWTVRFLIVGGLGSGHIETSFAECAKDVTDGKLKSAKDVYQKLAGTLPSDDEFAAEFAIARVSKPALARYYLRAMAQQMGGEDGPELVLNDDPSELTLEHVMPQNPDGGWTHIDPDAYQPLVKRLGNMALLKAKPNSEGKSKEFKHKVSDYEASPNPLTNDLASYQNWGPDEITDRQKKMAQIAVKTWPLNVR